MPLLALLAALLSSAFMPCDGARDIEDRAPLHTEACDGQDAEETQLTSIDLTGAPPTTRTPVLPPRCACPLVLWLESPLPAPGPSVPRCRGPPVR